MHEIAWPPGVMDHTLHIISPTSNGSHSFLVTQGSYIYYTKLYIFVT
jgi:hypothetical protein